MRTIGAVLAACLLGGVSSQAANHPKNALSVQDQETSISVSVKDDRTLVAKDRVGKILWKVDVIKKAGAPAVGEAVVRHLSLEDGKVKAVYGKHSFAEFDLRSGKLVSTGSD